MADYQLTQTGDEVQDILDSALKVTGNGVTLSQSGADVQALLNDVASEEFVRTADMTNIPANSDLNDYKNVGTYNCTRTVDAQTILNCPLAQAFVLVVDKRLGGGNATQTYTSLFGDTYVRTYQIYNTSWSTWRRVGKRFQVGSKTASINKATGSSVSITAPTISGYTFLHWIGSATSGWIGGTYIENMGSATTNIWVSASSATGTGSVVAWALYVEN